MKQTIDPINIYRKEIISFKEAAVYLSVSESHLYTLTSKRLIKHYKPNKKIYFVRQELNEWVLAKPIDTFDEIYSKMKKRRH